MRQLSFDFASVSASIVNVSETKLQGEGNGGDTGCTVIVQDPAIILGINSALGPNGPVGEKWCAIWLSYCPKT